MECLFLGDLAIGSDKKDLTLFDVPRADKMVVNFEGSLIDGQPKGKLLKRSFYNSKVSLDLLATLGITHVNVLNNHSLDLGYRVFENSVEALKDSGYKCIDYKSLEVTRLSNDLGVVSIGSRLIGTPRDWPHLEDEEIVSNLRRAIANSNLDRIVLYVHAGFEFERHPEPWIRQKLLLLAEITKVSLILCMHSHVIKGYDKVGETYIFYGLGNFYIENHHFFLSKLVYDKACDIGLAVGITQTGLEVYQSYKSDDSVRFQLFDFEQCLVNYGEVEDFKMFYDKNRRSYRLMIMPPPTLSGPLGALYVRLIIARASIIKALIPIKERLSMALLSRS